MKFPTGVVLSLTTGRLLCRFSDMHVLAEFVAGRPVWTHELANKETVEDLKRSILRQAPQLSKYDGSDITTDNFEEWLTQRLAELGETIELRSLWGAA